MRDPELWNIACDLEINPILIEAGYKLPKGVLIPGEAPDVPPDADLYIKKLGQIIKGFKKGQLAEEYYNQLPPRPEGTGEGDGKRRGRGDGKRRGRGDGEGQDPGGCGGVIETQDEAAAAQSAADWKVTLAQAVNAAKQRGTLPGGLARLVNTILNPEVPWQQILEDFVQVSLQNRDDYSWNRPNRRYISQGVYMPSMIGHEMGKLLIHLDTSGSMSGFAELLLAELQGILETNPTKVWVVQGDAKIQQVDEWIPSEGKFEITELKGWGGTNHTHLWDWLKEQDADPECIVCLTDGYTDWGKDPEIPVLWALTPQSGAIDPPFGRKVVIKQ